MKEIQIQTRQRAQIAEGGIAKIYRTKIALNLTGKEVRYINKTFTIREFKKEETASRRLDENIKKYKKLKEIGIRVMPTYRKISDREILMTDLTNGGKHSVYSPNNFDPKTNRPLSD